MGVTFFHKKELRWETRGKKIKANAKKKKGGNTITVSAGKDFAAACEKNINTTIFPTHTPESAGLDVFPFQLIEKYFHSYWPDMGLDRDAFFQ